MQLLLDAGADKNAANNVRILLSPCITTRCLFDNARGSSYLTRLPDLHDCVTSTAVQFEFVHFEIIISDFVLISYFPR